MEGEPAGQEENSQPEEPTVEGAESEEPEGLCVRIWDWDWGL